MKHHGSTGIDRVLIVEDDPVSAMVLRRGLENRGYGVTTASDGAEALDLLSREPYRIVISDWMMPQMDGLELCRRIRGANRARYTYFILLTAKSQKEDRTEGLRAGVDDYLLKPLDPAELEARLRVATRILQMQEDLYRHALIVRKTNNGVVTLTPDGAIEWANDAFGSMAGALPGTVAGRPFAEALGVADREGESLDSLQKGLESGAPFNLEVAVSRADGSTCWLAIDVSPIQGDTGGAAQCVAIATDVTERKQQQEQIRRQFERITALRAIDIAINFGRDLSLTLAVLLDQIPSHVGVDAAAILELGEDEQTLTFAAGRGFRDDRVSARRIRIGEGCTGEVARTLSPIAVGSLEEENEFADRDLLQREGFQAYAGIPMISRGELIGVLELFHRKPYTPDAEQQEFLATVASQAAIAIANARLLAQLQHSNEELSNAYDSTIEGWSRALDLRDQETEGHSQRVTDLTLKLAEAMGFSEDGLVHVRRGALLHDIGKMGVPDAILLKPGPLCQEEWELMRRHPVYAFEMLSPIHFLHAALDIPYCHHEKWDGSGYPRGLKGEEIPMAARIFAVVDVWDALRSDRPYRKAWSSEEVCAHIESLSGSHFDPGVVQAFLRVVRQSGEPQRLDKAA